MPIHDWTRVDAGIFHHFHRAWISELSRVLNRGLSPSDHYALAEPFHGELAPGVTGTLDAEITFVATTPPAHPRLPAEAELYASKANAIVIRHVGQHDIIAIVEIVSPGNKSSRHGLRALIDKAVSDLRKGIHLVVLDLFPPGPSDPQGIHNVVWDEVIDNDTDNYFVLPANKRLTLASYIGGPVSKAFVEPTSVGASLAEMPLFLSPEMNIPLPLESTYQSAWEAVPSFWRDVLTGPVSP